MIHRLIAYVRTLGRRHRVEAETDEELQFHLEMEMKARRELGLSVEEARRAAFRDFGGVTQVREKVRLIRAPFYGLWRDVRYAARLVRRQPAFSLAVVLSLAGGIGVTTA